MNMKSTQSISREKPPTHNYIYSLSCVKKLNLTTAAKPNTYFTMKSTTRIFVSSLSNRPTTQASYTNS